MKETKNNYNRAFMAFHQNADDGAGEVYIFGDITDDQYFDGETSAFSLKNQLANFNGKNLNVYIDSYGGSVSAGWGIYNLLKSYAQDKNAIVTTHGMGFVASAALYPFMAGSQRIAHTPSAYFFHNVSTLAIGYASDLRKAADDADKFTEIGIGAFTENTHLSADEIQNLMNKETWLTPEEALSMGIATAILQESLDASASQAAKNAIFQRIFRESAPKGCIELTHEPAPQKALSNLKRLQRLYKNKS